MKKIIFIVLTASFLCFGSCCIATGQAPVAQSDQITDGGTQEIIQDDSSSTGTFEPVTVDASANSDVKLQFPVSLASKTVTIAAMDGGTPDWRRRHIDRSGWVALLFVSSQRSTRSAPRCRDRPERRRGLATHHRHSAIRGAQSGELGG